MQTGFLLDQASLLQRDLPRRTIKDAIADKLTALIASGVMEPGDELPGERELAAALSVSRETVRGAIQTLALRGIVEVAQGARTRVARVDLTTMAVGVHGHLNVNDYDLESVHAARLLLEQQVVSDAAERITADELKRLAASLCVQQVMQHDPVHFLICDREFHLTIYRACGNPLLADIVTDLYTYMMEHRRRAVARPKAISNSIADHRNIFAALRTHDRKAAMTAFAAHEQRIYSTTRQSLANAKIRD